MWVSHLLLPLIVLFANQAKMPAAHSSTDQVLDETVGMYDGHIGPRHRRNARPLSDGTDGAEGAWMGHSASLSSSEILSNVAPTTFNSAGLSVHPTMEPIAVGVSRASSWDRQVGYLTIYSDTMAPIVTEYPTLSQFPTRFFSHFPTSPTFPPSLEPSQPSAMPSDEPSAVPSLEPTQPTSSPSAEPTIEVTSQPSTAPSALPTAEPSFTPSATPSFVSSVSPACNLSIRPTRYTRSPKPLTPPSSLIAKKTTWSQYCTERLGLLLHSVNEALTYIIRSAGVI